MNKIIICPTEEKKIILKEYQKDSFLHQVRFLNKKEFLDNYFFEYNEKALYYLMDKYKYNIDVARVYLSNLYFIDISKNYSNKKLSFLKELKEELIDNNLLIFHNNFKRYLFDAEVEISHYYDFDKYIEDALNIKNNVGVSKLSAAVYELQSMEDEVSFVCIKIRELLKRGVDINKIYLCNVGCEYYYTIDRIFNYYNIPVNIPYKDSIYSTRVVQEFLSNNVLDLENTNKNTINRKLLNVLGSLVEIEDDSDVYKEILIDKLKNTYLSNKKYVNAVNIYELTDREFNDDEYVFVLGFNLNSLPKTYKDIEFISDSLKDEVDLYTTSYLNIREKAITTTLLSKIKNIIISYKLSSPFQKYYPSILIKEMNLDVIKPDVEIYNYSDIYNKIRLGEMLDRFYIYGEKNNYLYKLNNTYNISYNTYSNGYTGINNSLFLDSIKKPLKLAYTSLNSYHECKFKYYINYVLKIDEYENTFSAFIGSLYHKILSLYKKNNFDLDTEWNKYLESRDLSLKEKVLLVKIKKDLIELIDVLKEQQLLTGYDNTLEEKEVKVIINKNVDVEFVGYIDKIMYLEKNDNVYYSIIDYKSGNIDTHIEPMKYGLHMQLPIYLYLFNNSNVFNNSIFTGIYYQNILFSYPKWSNDFLKEKKERYMLKGYSTDDVSSLERFDSTYEDSNYIKSMKYDAEKGFSRYTKLIGNDELNLVIKYTKDKIDKSIDEILEGDFKINPKVYGKDNVSCEFCKYRDLCYMTPNDLVYLEKQDDLSFLGGDL